MNLEHRFLSKPLDLHWAGWRADTLTLQRYGWQLSARQNIYDNSMQIALRHPESKVHGISNVAEFDYMRSLNDPCMERPMPVLAFRLASDFVIQEIHHGTDMNFVPIDADPAYEMMTKLSDAKFFREINTNVKQVFLEQASMGEILDIALQKQAPRQAEIRQKMIRDEEMKIQRNSRLQAELRLVA